MSCLSALRTSSRNAGVQSGQGFVEQQHRRGHGQGPGQGHPLFFTAAEVVHGPLQQGAEPELIDDFGQPPVVFRSAAVVPPAVMDVFFHAQVRKQGGVLIDHAHPPLFGRPTGDVAVLDDDPSGIGPPEPGDGFQDHGLARPGGPQEDEKLPGPNFQIEIVRRKPGDAQGQVFQPDHDARRGRETTRRARNSNRQIRISHTATGWEYLSPYAVNRSYTITGAIMGW